MNTKIKKGERGKEEREGRREERGERKEGEERRREGGGKMNILLGTLR